MHQCIKFILFWNATTCFERSFFPSSGVQDCTYSNRHLSNRYCYLLVGGYPLARRQQFCLVAVCTALNSRRWTERPSETCSIIPKQNKFDTVVNLVGFTIEINGLNSQLRIAAGTARHHIKWSE